MTVRILTGDCRDILPTFEANSVDAVVCDPPYELGFMGREWDKRGVAFDPATWEAVKRVMKPGAFLLAFGGTRTIHRMICAIEDVGLEIRDQIVWMYGQGFPKSLNLGDGRGTALKPAHEPIVVARKPLIGTVATNVTEYGTGALNINASRIPHGVDVDLSRQQHQHADTSGMRGLGDSGYRSDHQQPLYQSAGRWPANVVLSHSPGCVEVGTKRVKGANRSGQNAKSGAFGKNGVYGDADGGQQPHDYTDPDGYETVTAWECEPDCAVRLLDEQSGERKSGSINGVYQGFGTNGIYGEGGKSLRQRDASSGGASRFFYTAKASRSEREIGMQGAPLTKVGMVRLRDDLTEDQREWVLSQLAEAGVAL